ncbi:hypothetical protein TWF225_002572 [Orbilia oligospora]|uniref:Uncharacterized protein n=1 Tax=Orbilia oligospora TaxID=2813651 RepID=A0A7C8PNT0_ORBOL|nr:hypothetical protein TWF751_004631 [Orbilia oligospora]KAF3190079.1 hypothetical protein TWF225_002572 [Orbilia oligospora]KAF3266179.1 hypothetical protein TWF217_001859 [Orbilia oligospora]KAF3268711.1 hypothetical protein TWF128_007081 [Orbilia oligospora]KAF3297165.1 hypothetical protein TWF132_008521 [Orbilia oligospora]
MQVTFPNSTRETIILGWVELQIPVRPQMWTRDYKARREWTDPELLHTTIGLATGEIDKHELRVELDVVALKEGSNIFLFHPQVGTKILETCLESLEYTSVRTILRIPSFYITPHI